MTSTLIQLSDRSLHRLLEALTSGRLTAPFSSLTLAQLVPQEQVPPLHDELARLQNSGLNVSLLQEWIQSLLHQREGLRAESGHLELVMTGPESPGTMVRDTGVVVRQMFGHATQSIWICGFAVYQGKEVFQALAQQMTSVPDLRVRMFLNVERRPGDLSAPDIVIAKFQQRFKETQWPNGVRLPDLYFDPRSVDLNARTESACLHAKFVIADAKHVFISSANFTEAAQERNIEAGVFSDHPRLAEELRAHFQSLIDHGYLQQAKWHGQQSVCR
jgi:phosphatidylserine/phosphatidylglycerophosphate/cardiolipin synthase-like enzyme